MVTTTALDRARAGDGDAFRELTDPHRGELQLHCYRILGSVQDAEDMVQETLLAAWRGLDRFEERASMRTWLYKIATNRCLNALRDSGRRPQARRPVLAGRRPARAHPPGRAAVARALPGRAAGRPARRRTRPGSPLRGPRSARTGVHGRAAAPAPAAASGAGAARRARLPRGAGRRHARGQRDLGEQRPAAGPGHAQRPVPRRWPRPRTGAALSARAPARQPVRGRVRGGRRRKARRPAHRRRVADHAARTAGIPGSRRDRPLLREPDLVGRPARPAGADPREQPARVRLLPARPAGPARAGARADRADPRRRQDLRDHPLRRQQPVPPLRAAQDPARLTRPTAPRARRRSGFGAVWQTAVSWLARMRPSLPTTTGCTTTTRWAMDARSTTPRRRACCSGSAAQAPSWTRPVVQASTRRRSRAGASPCGQPTEARRWSRVRRPGSGGSGWRSRACTPSGRIFPRPPANGLTLCSVSGTHWCTPPAATRWLRRLPGCGGWPVPGDTW